MRAFYLQEKMEKNDKVQKQVAKNFEAFHAIKRDMEEFEAKLEGRDYWFTIREYDPNCWVPQAREGALLVN